MKLLTCRPSGSPTASAGLRVKPHVIHGVATHVMTSNVLLARLSSGFYLAALALVFVVLSSLLLSLVAAPIGQWFEHSGIARLLIVSFLYVGAPLAALFVILGLAARCSVCGKPYLTVEWVASNSASSRDRPNGLSLVRSHLAVACTGCYTCSKCGHPWRKVS